jgi:hypothetical protein
MQQLNSNYNPQLLNEIYQFNTQNTLTNYKYYFIKINNTNNKLNTTFINDVFIEDLLINEETSINTSLIGFFDDVIITDIQAQFPLFLISKNIIKIPSKIEYVLRRYVSRKLLREINANEDVAIELCLLFTSLLSSTYFKQIEDPNNKGWKSLHAKYLREFLCVNSMTYKKIITALENPTSKGVIIECDHKPIIGKKNFYYRLGDAYTGKGIKSYKLKTNVAIKLLNKRLMQLHNKSETNPIIKNLIEFYNIIELPTIGQIEKEADRLIKLKYATKKGKTLKRLGKHSKTYFKNANKFSFVEDSITVYKYLTENGILFPEVGSIKSGGRIIDSLALIPSWIRRMIKIKGKLNVEADYSCLHPNIAINLYGGTKEYLTHGDLGLAMNTNVNLVKEEHLSFFNKEVWQMKQSPLFEYYDEKEKKMLNKIIAEKYNSEFKHCVTSRRLFAKEVEVMTAVIEKLNSENIYVGYVYDAVFCHPSEANRVKEVMDEIILKFGIKTTAKLSNGKKYNPIVATLKETKIDLEILKPKSIEIIEQVLKIDSGLINFGYRIKDSVLKQIEEGIQLIFNDAMIVFEDGEMIADKVLRIYDIYNPKAIYVTKSHIFDKKNYIC